MQILAFFAVVSSIPALFSTLVSASHADGHAGVARLEKHRRTADSLGVGNTTLTKRNFSNAKFTYYYDDVAQVACGGWYNGNDYIVALNSAQFAGGSLCGKQITISYEGRSTTAAIVDECPGCPWSGLDLSTSLFSYLANGLEAGVIYGTWDFADAAPPPPPPPPPSPKATSKPPPPPPPPTTSHHSSTPPPIKVHSSSSATPSSSHSPSSTKSSSSIQSSIASSLSSSSISSSSASSTATSTTSSKTPKSSSAAPSATPSTQSGLAQLYLAYIRLTDVPVNATHAAADHPQ